MQIRDCVQGSEQWAEYRRGIPTASCADKIVTPKNWELSKSADDYIYQLLAESITPPQYWIEDEYQSGPMIFGTRTEQEARDYFAFHTGLEVEQVGFVLTDDGRFGASPDGLINGDAGLELKCPKHKTQIKYLVNGGLPDEYKPQVHANMLVTGRKSWHFLSYAIGLPPHHVEVQADQFTVKLAEAFELFYARLQFLRAKIQPQDAMAGHRPTQESYF